MFLDLAWEHWLVVLSAIVSVAGASKYIYETAKGNTKPNKVSWFLWAFAPLSAFTAALFTDADPWTTVRTFLAGFLPLIVLFFAFANPKSYWKLGPFDYLCGVTAMLGIVLWFLISSPEIAILFLALADVFAVLPTVVKAWKFPETETGIVYITSLISVLLVLPSIPQWDIANSAFQIALIVGNSALIFSVYRRRLGFLKK